MATSGSTDWTQATDGMVRRVLRILGRRDRHADATYYAEVLDAMNGMIRAWQMEGLFIFKLRDVTVFLEDNAKYYDVGPTGDQAAIEPVKTEVSTAAASGASAVLVDAITGISDTDVIGVELDDGSIQWTTVNGAPSGSTVTLTAALTDDVAVDNHVYAYSTLPSRPVQVVSARFVDSDGYERDLWVASREEYANVVNKSDTGDCLMVYPDMRTTNMRLYVWPTCDDVKKRIIVTVAIPPDDFDAAANDADLPPEWVRAIVLNTAVEYGPEIGVRIPPDLRQLAFESKMQIAASDVELTSVRFSVEREY